jgi:hypothetical protein
MYSWSLLISFVASSEISGFSSEISGFSSIILFCLSSLPYLKTTINLFNSSIVLFLFPSSYVSLVISSFSY